MEEPPPSRGPSTAPGPRWVLGGGGELWSRPCQPLATPAPGLQQLHTKLRRRQPPAPSPSTGRGRAPPAASSSFAGLRLPQGNEAQNNPGNWGGVGQSRLPRLGGDCFAPPGRGGQGWSPPTALTPPGGACLVLTGPGHRPPELGGTAELRPPAPGGFFLFLFLLKDISSPAGPSGAVGSAQGGEVRGEVRGSTAQQPEGGQGAAGSPPGAPQGLPRPPSPGGRSQPAG